MRDDRYVALIVVMLVVGVSIGYGAGVNMASRRTVSTTVTSIIIEPHTTTVTRRETITTPVTATRITTVSTTTPPPHPSLKEAQVEVEAKYTVVTNIAEIKRYASMSKTILPSPSISLNSMKNPALLFIDVRLINKGPGTIYVRGTGCGMNVFANISFTRIEEGNARSILLHGICLPLWCVRLRPGKSIVDKTFSRYNAFLVERPFKAEAKISVEICGECSLTSGYVCRESGIIEKTISIHLS